MDISVIILTLNAEKYIDKQLQQLQSQSIAPKEIIIIDSSSKDKTCEIVKRYGINPIIIKKEEFSHSGTRNYAASIATGEILIFLSQDAIPCNSFLIDNLTKILNQNNQIAASYARHIPYPNAKPTEVVVRRINYPNKFLIKDKSFIPLIGIKTFFFSNSCSAIKKKVLQEIGGFCEDVPIAEDIIFAAYTIYKGYKIAYVPSAKVMHSHNFSLIEYYKRYYKIGQAFAKYKDILQYKTTIKEGNTIFKEQIKYLLLNKKIFFFPYMLAENILKYLGFQVGLRIGKIKLKYNYNMSQLT